MRNNVTSSSMTDEEKKEWFKFGDIEYGDLFYYNIIETDSNWNYGDEFCG